MTEVRQATTDDAKEIFKLILEMHAETDFSNFVFCPEKAFAGLFRWIDKPDAAMFVAVTDGRVVGILACEVMPLWFSNDRCMVEQLLFVTQQSRGTRAAYRLVEAFIEWTKADVQHIKMGVATGVGASAERLYQKFGLHCVGGNFIKHIKG